MHMKESGMTRYKNDNNLVKIQTLNLKGKYCARPIRHNL